MSGSLKRESFSFLFYLLVLSVAGLMVGNSQKFTPDNLPEISSFGQRAESRFLGKENQVTRSNTENKYFKYRQNYFFDEESKIKGKLIFTPDKRVRVNYHYKGEDKAGFWKWEDMGDHVVIEANTELGDIIISERPKSALKTVLVRWGGELMNVLTDASLK